MGELAGVSAYRSSLENRYLVVMKSFHHNAIEIGPVSRLVHRFGHLGITLKQQILNQLQLTEESQEPNARFRNFVATLKPQNPPDRSQLAVLWRNIDAVHPRGPAQEGNQFLEETELQGKADL